MGMVSLYWRFLKFSYNSLFFFKPVVGCNGSLVGHKCLTLLSLSGSAVNSKNAFPRVPMSLWGCNGVPVVVDNRIIGWLIFQELLDEPFPFQGWLLPTSSWGRRAESNKTSSRKNARLFVRPQGATRWLEFLDYSIHRVARQME